MRVEISRNSEKYAATIQADSCILSSVIGPPETTAEIKTDLIKVGVGHKKGIPVELLVVVLTTSISQQEEGPGVECISPVHVGRHRRIQRRRGRTFLDKVCNRKKKQRASERAT